MMMAFAEFERNMILTRTSEGRAIARQRPGYKEGLYSELAFALGVEKDKVLEIILSNH